MSAVRTVYAAYPDGGDLPEEGGMRITVIGTGYLGAVHAACMAEIGHDVLGVDSDVAKITALREGRAARLGRVTTRKTLKIRNGAKRGVLEERLSTLSQAWETGKS